MNIWQKFEKLTDKRDFRVGEILAHIGNSSRLEDAAGQEFTAIGTSVAVGQKAFVRDGVIQGQAPALSESTVYV